MNAPQDKGIIDRIRHAVEAGVCPQLIVPTWYIRALLSELDQHRARQDAYEEAVARMSAREEGA